MGLLGLLTEKLSTHQLPQRLIHHARALRKSVQFYYYQLAAGISSTLAYARVGVQDWFRTRRRRPRQVELKLMC